MSEKKEEKKDLVCKYETDHGEVKLSPQTVAKYLVSGGGNISQQDVVMFINLCKYQKLNPFLREAYLIKYSKDVDEPATIVVGKDVFTKRAAKNEKFNGAIAGIWVSNKKGVEKRTGTIIGTDEELCGGWAMVYRKDWTYPVEISVNLKEYIGLKKDGTPNRQWKRMPTTMIRKVALMQALREAFPENFQGLYDGAEMQLDELPTNEIKQAESIDNIDWINQIHVDIIGKGENKDDIKIILAGIEKRKNNHAELEKYYNFLLKKKNEVLKKDNIKIEPEKNEQPDIF